MLEEIYTSLSDVEIMLSDTLGKFACVEPVLCPPHLVPVREACEILRQVLSRLETTSCIQAKIYAYDEIDWMDTDFVDELNRSSLADRWVKVGEAISAWNMLHSHLGRRAPLCPLLDPAPEETDPEDF